MKKAKKTNLGKLDIVGLMNIVKDKKANPKARSAAAREVWARRSKKERTAVAMAAVKSRRANGIATVTPIRAVAPVNPFGPIESMIRELIRRELGLKKSA